MSKVAVGSCPRAEDSSYVRMAADVLRAMCVWKYVRAGGTRWPMWLSPPHLSSEGAHISLISPGLTSLDFHKPSKKRDLDDVSLNKAG